MNILLFAMAMLMLLASMTYAKLDSFRSLQLSKSQFEIHLKKNDFNYFDAKTNSWYYSITVKKQDSKKTKSPKIGLSKLSFYPLLDSKEREKDPSKVREILELSKNLILTLFVNQPNVQKMLEVNPDIIDQFFNELVKAIDKLPEKTKIKKIEELSAIELEDEELKNFRYEICKENHKVLEQGKDEVSYSFLKELTANAGKTRPFLASKNLLKSIFKDDRIVEQILEMRISLRKSIINDKMEPPEAMTQFEEFLKSLCPYLNDNLFDYSITKTDPKEYE